MPITQTLTAPGAAPARYQDPDIFIARMDARLAWENVNVGEMTTLIGQINSTASQMSSDAATATAQAAIATTQAGLATTNGAAQVALAAAQVVLATNQANAAAASAITAINAPGTNATSTTSDTVALGSTMITVQTGKALVPGMFVLAASTASPGNYNYGQITAYNSGTGDLTINVLLTGGGGTFAAWTVSLAAITSAAQPMTKGKIYFFAHN